jgi:hypothetical protein
LTAKLKDLKSREEKSLPVAQLIDHFVQK